MTNRIDKLQQFLVQSPDDCFLNHALALEYVKAGNDQEAKLLFEKNLQFDPSYVATYYHLGKLLERNGQTPLALEIFEKGMVVARSANDLHTHSELRAAYDDLADEL